MSNLRLDNPAGSRNRDAAFAATWALQAYGRATERPKVTDTLLSDPEYFRELLSDVITDLVHLGHEHGFELVTNAIQMGLNRFGEEVEDAQATSYEIRAYNDRVIAARGTEGNRE